VPIDLTTLDLIAFVWFIGIWGAFTIAQDHLLNSRAFVNRHLVTIRVEWMEQMLGRDNRIMDAQLVGHTMNSCSFFASTTALVLAGLVGSFGAIERAHELVGNLSFTAHVSRAFFETKLLLLVAIFTFAFFKFTWALRQYNYCCALIGSAPMPPVAEPLKRELAASMAEAVTLAVRALNGGLRAYYFALAALAWVVGPLPFMAASSFVLLVLVRRQGFSRTEKVIRAHAETMRRHRTDAAAARDAE